MKHPWFTKLAALAAVVLLLLFGLGLIEDVVQGRQHYRSMTAQSVANSLAGPQTLMGPLIHSACVESWDVETGKGEERRSEERRRAADSGENAANQAYTDRGAVTHLNYPAP